jgi:predicted hydrolase (HD superfamily)
MFYHCADAAPANQQPANQPTSQPATSQPANQQPANQPTSQPSTSQIMEDGKSRTDALALLFEFTQSDALRRHAFAVEAAMRAYARSRGGDPDEWGIVGLLHDFDYERHPTAEEHPIVGEGILAERGWPERVRRAILAHAPHTGVVPESPMERALFACDELCGFLTAVSYVQPDRRFASVKVTSVRKKLKDKTFARAVSREDIARGAALLGVELDEHIAFVLAALVELEANPPTPTDASRAARPEGVQG